MPEAAVVVEPPQTAAGCVIWLHGLGADGHDFEPVLPFLGRALVARTRFVFPHAPRRPVTINGGMVMRAWYDIRDMDIARRADEGGVRESAAILEALLATEQEAGIPAERIVLAGFSQGGAIALHTALRLAQPVAGVLALSTYLPLPDRLADEITDAGRAQRVFMGHGEWDPIVPLDLAERSARRLREHGVAVDWHSYPMQHSLCEEELADIGGWLEQRLPE